MVIWNEANSDTFWQPQEGAPARLRGAARPLLGPPARVRPGRERPDDDRVEPRSGRIHPRHRRRLSRERPRAAALRQRRPQPVPALSRRVSDRPPRRLHRPGRLRPAGGRPRRVLRRHGAAGRRRSGTSRTASRRRVANGRRSHYTGQENVTHTLAPGEQAAQLGDGAPARALPAARGRVLQLPPRRRDACSRAGSRACSGPTGSASRRSPPTGRRSPRSGAAPSTAPPFCGARRRRAAGRRARGRGASSGPGSRSGGSARA